MNAIPGDAPPTAEHGGTKVRLFASLEANPVLFAQTGAAEVPSVKPSETRSVDPRLKVARDPQPAPNMLNSASFQGACARLRTLSCTDAERSLSTANKTLSRPFAVALALTLILTRFVIGWEEPGPARLLHQQLVPAETHPVAPHGAVGQEDP